MEEIVKVHVSGIAQVDTPFGPTPILLLEDDNERVLVIAIGGAEASSIAIALREEHLPVPNTHDLMMNIFDEMNIRIKKGEIYDIQSNRFLARVILESEKGESIINGRPSDIIALAVRAGADIYVTEDVMQRASIEKSALLKGREEEGEDKEE
ncbi:MAG: bifunctional nuclease family protein [Candidatus Bathyarchaeia archaeon]